MWTPRRWPVPVSASRPGQVRRSAFGLKGFSCAAFLILFAHACGAQSVPETPDWLRSEWGTHSMWDDGMVEVNTFDATTTLHGKPRPYIMMVLFSATQVLGSGAEAVLGGHIPAVGGSLDPAIKMHIVSDTIETDDFPYDQASTVLAGRLNPAHVFSSVATSHDWQGITAKRFRGGATPVFEAWTTVHPGELRRELPLDVVPLEAVPLFLRAMDFTTTASFRCLPTLMAHRIPWSGVVPEPDVLTLQATVDGTETTTTAAGTFDCHRVKVTTPDGRVPMVLWIEKEFPNRLVAKTTASGKAFSLRHSERRTLSPSDPR